MRRTTLCSLPLLLVLASCGGGNYVPPQATSQSHYTQTSAISHTSTSTHTSISSARSDKENVIKYLKENGTYNNNTYGISKSSKNSQWDVFDYIYYKIEEDEFVSSVSMDYRSASGSVSNFASITWKWGSFTSGSAVGATTYKTTTSKMNGFGFTVSFGFYPSFTVTSYRSLMTDLPSTKADDASICSDCLGRAINNFIKSAPSMGAASNLW